MKRTIGLQLLAGAAILQISLLTAIAQNTPADSPAQEPGAEALKVGEKLTPPPLGVTTERPADLLAKDLDGQNLKGRGWSDKRMRYVDISEFAVPMQEPITAEKVVEALNTANLAIYIVAMQSFTEYMGQKAGFEANLSWSGSPVGREFKQAQDGFQKDLETLEKELGMARSKVQESEAIMASASADEVTAQKDLDRRIAEQQKIVQDLNRKAQYGPTTLDRARAAMDALVKKVDTNYNAAALQEVQKDRHAKAEENLGALNTQKGVIMSDKLAAAKKDYENLQSQIKQLAQNVTQKTEEAKKYYEDYKEVTLNSKHNYRADYDIVGLTPIKYYYGIIEDGKGGAELQVAGAFAWSPALERATRGILDTVDERSEAPKYTERFPPSEALTKPSAVALEDWIIEQKNHMDAFGPARWYVDDDGTRYFLGCAYALVGQGAKFNINLRDARTSAIRNLGLCLNVKAQVQGTKEDSSIIGQKDNQAAGKFDNMAKLAREGLDIASVAREGQFTLPLKGGQQSEPIRWFVMKVSEKSIRDAHKAVLQQAENAARAHEAQYKREGVRAAANAFVKEKKDDTSPKNQAYGDTKRELDSNYRPVSPAAKGQTDSGGNTVLIRPGTNAPASGSVQPFIKGDKSKVPDDF